MMLVARQAKILSLPSSGVRWASTAAEKDAYKVVVVGAGTFIAPLL